MTSPAPFLLIGNHIVEIVPKSVQRMHLNIYPPHGRIALTIPRGTPESVYRLFVIDKWTWVKQQIHELQQQARQTERLYRSGENHYFQGKRYLLQVIEQARRPAVRLGHQHIDLYVAPDSTLEQRERLLLRWYRQQLKAHIPRLIAKWEPRMGVSVQDWGVKRMKTKWGTCNIAAQRIWLNLELAKKPLHCLEYIVVHELVHLLEHHHTERFTQLMDQFLPRWRWLRAELNQLPVAHWDWGY